MTQPSKTTVEAIANVQWCRPGEQLLGSAQPSAHVGSTVAGRHSAPHQVHGHVPDTVPAETPSAKWPMPTRSISAGHFLEDEWAYDPAIWGWAHSPAPTTLAVRLADLLTAGKGTAALLFSPHRFAVARINPTFEVWQEIGAGELLGFRALGVTTADRGDRLFVRAEFRDGSSLMWLRTNAAVEAGELNRGMGRG